MFKFTYRPSEFFLRGKFLPIWGPCGHILKATTVKFGMRVRSWGSLPQAKFCKNDIRDIPLWGKFIPKSTIFGDFWGRKPTFTKPKRQKIWCEGANLGDPLHTKFCKNWLRGIPLFRKIIQKLAIFAILTPVSPHF